MEIKDLFAKKSKRPAPLECDCESEITPEMLEDWAVDICKSVFGSSESSGEEVG